MDNQAREILEKYQLKKTTNRIEVLKVLLENEGAKSHSEINKFLNPSLDRVSLYRVLQVFEKNKIVHQFNDLQGIQRFAICSSKCTKQKHHDEHAHLECAICKKTYCLKWSFDMQNLPDSFEVHKVEINVKGICETCKLEKK